MANAMRSSRNTRQSGSNYCNFGSAKLYTWLWGIGGEKLVQKPLDKLIKESKRVEKRILHYDKLRIENGWEIQLNRLAKEENENEGRCGFEGGWSDIDGCFESLEL
jgi:hypothetical protein